RLAPTEASRRWATLLQQIFEVDSLACPTCHGAMRIVAFITQASVIDRILAHLRTRAAREAHGGPRSPPSTWAPTNRGASERPPPASAPPTVTAILTAREARARGGGHATARLSVRAWSAITPYPRPTPIEFPIQRKASSCGSKPAASGPAPVSVQAAERALAVTLRSRGVLLTPNPR
ncbi:MAG: hypothetical protein O9271_17885, partial [Gemmatimonas sp.]|nr:hypothetical protein [Gemmatimonas sp.]